MAATTATVTRAKHVAAMTANTMDTITVSGDSKFIEVANRGSSDIYFTVNGDVPTVGGDNTYIVLASAALIVPSADKPDVVKLISAGTPAYSVTGIK
jgi:hypothetical protein